MTVKAKPEGYHTVTPYLTVKDADQLIVFLKAAFDATSVECVRNQNGQIMHAEVRIGDSIIMVGTKPDATSSAMLYLYVDDADAVYNKALSAGGISVMEPRNQFYGDRNAAVQDMFGNQWWIATHIEDMSMEELQKRAQMYKPNCQ